MSAANRDRLQLALLFVIVVVLLCAVLYDMLWLIVVCMGLAGISLGISTRAIWRDWHHRRQP